MTTQKVRIKLHRLMSRREYARHRGISEARVRQYIEAGAPVTQSVIVKAGIPYCEKNLRRKNLRHERRAFYVHALDVLQAYADAGLRDAACWQVYGFEDEEEFEESREESARL